MMTIDAFRSSVSAAEPPAGISPALQALWHFALIHDRSRDGCFKAFRENHWLGFAVFAGVAVDLALR